MKSRYISDRLRQRADGKLGRIVLLTGARQVGKTTLVRHAFPEYRYISVEDPSLRPTYSSMSACDWVERYPMAIVDEVQKVPSLIETIKAAYDQNDNVRYILLGSSQILLSAKVKESLAGRVAIEELWPLTLVEVATMNWEEVARDSRLLMWLKTGCKDNGILKGIPGADAGFARSLLQFDEYLQFGGMPAILDSELSEEEKRLWLRDYQRTFLERDVADLAVLRDLEPFVTAQKAVAGRTAQAVNFSDLARVSSVTPNTAQRFMRYLEMSYQVLVLRPFFRNSEKSLSKTPKIHFMDPGVMRAILGRWGEPTGADFESAVISEIYRQTCNAGLDFGFSHLRTQDGREVDLLIELPDGFVAIEIKQTRKVARVDARHLRSLGQLLDRPLLAALVVSQDPVIQDLGDDIMGVPAAWLLGAGE